MPIPKFSDWSRLDEAKGGDAVVVVKSDSMWSRINDMVVCIFPGRTSREDAKRKTLELMKAKWGELPYRDQDVIRDMNVYLVPMNTLVSDGIGMSVLESEAVNESSWKVSKTDAASVEKKLGGRYKVISLAKSPDSRRAIALVSLEESPGDVYYEIHSGRLDTLGDPDSGQVVTALEVTTLRDAEREFREEVKDESREYKVEESSSGETFDYMMLSRLQSDCEYYLGHGGRSPHVLHQGDEKKQIAEMKRIWKKLKVKPEWLSMEDIKDYEKKMVG